MATLKRVLLIAYNFPPLNNIASLRIRKLLPRLAERGYEFYVVTVAENHIGNPNPALLTAFDSRFTVVRTGMMDLPGLARAALLRSKNLLPRRAALEREPALAPAQLAAPPPATFKTALRRWLFLPDQWAGWVPFAYRAGRKILAQHPIDFIYSSSPPFSGAVVAAMLQRASGRPWLIEYRDAWSRFDLYPDRYSPLRRWTIRRLEAWCIRSVDYMIGAAEAIREDVVAKYPRLADRSRTIYNSFEPKDYAGETPRGDAFKIVYTGDLNDHQDIRPLFVALKELGEEKVLDLARVEVHFYGASVRWDVEGFCAYAGVKGGNHGPVFFQEVPKLQKGAELLLLVENPRDPVHIPGKIFEYIGAGRPILALGPPSSEAARLVTAHGLGQACAHGELAAIKRALRDYYQAWERGENGPTGGTDLREFQAEAMADAMVEVFQQLESKPKNRP